MITKIKDGLEVNLLQTFADFFNKSNVILIDVIMNLNYAHKKSLQINEMAFKNCNEKEVKLYI